MPSQATIENGENGNGPEMLKSCALHKRFFCKGEKVNVMSCPSDVPASSKTRFETSNGTVVNLVVLGSKEHLKKLNEAIEDIELRLHSAQLKLKLLNVALGVSVDAQKLDNEIARLEKEMAQRIEELTFLQQQQNSQENEDDDDSEIDADEDITSDSFGPKKGLLDRDSTTTDESVMHVTAETFGKLKKLVVINHKTSEKGFRKPVARQYFLKGTLHRENKEYKVQNIELFTDLIYIGCFGKCERLMESGHFKWIAFVELLLVLLPILSRWRNMTHLKNMIHHNDLSAKLYHFIYSAIVILMGVSITSAFTLSGDTNTGNLFIGLHLIGGLLIDLFLAACAIFFMPQFRYSLLIRMAANAFYIIPFLTILGYPADGTSARYNLRMTIWGLAVLFEHITPIIWMILLGTFKALGTENRVAVNIEHLSDRHCNLIVIALGEFVVSILSAGDFTLGNPSLNLFNVVFSFMNALSLYYLYFRAETTSHHQHALRRSKWTGMSWGLIHIPIATLIVTVAACFYQIVYLAKLESISGVSDNLEYSLQTIYGVCYSCLFFSFSILTLIHLDEEPEGTLKPKTINKGIRIVVKFVIGLIFLLFALTLKITPQNWIFISTALTVVAAVVEEVGRIKKKTPKQP